MTMPIVVMLITFVVVSPLVVWILWQCAQSIREDRQLRRDYPNAFKEKPMTDMKWGGDFHGSHDPMPFEIRLTPQQETREALLAILCTTPCADCNSKADRILSRWRLIPVVAQPEYTDDYKRARGACHWDTVTNEVTVQAVDGTILRAGD